MPPEVHYFQALIRFERSQSIPDIRMVYLWVVFAYFVKPGYALEYRSMSRTTVQPTVLKWTDPL
jgi:hypothetical protein